VPSPPYYEGYYEQGREEPADQPIDLNMLFHPDDNITVVDDRPHPDSKGILMMEEEDKPYGEHPLTR